MKDPVILPSSRITVDRPVIQRHLLSDNVIFTFFKNLFKFTALHTHKYIFSLLNCLSIFQFFKNLPFNALSLK